ITAFDVQTGDRLETLAMGGPVKGLARDGAMLYATVSGSPDRFRVIDLSGPDMVLRGSLDLLEPAGRVFVADAVAWAILASSLTTIDLSDPDNLRPLTTSTNLRLIKDVALDGSGLGVLSAVGLGKPGELGVIETKDPSAPLALVTQIDLPGPGQGVAVFAG